MIKVAVIGGPILSGGKKNLIMEYFHHMDKGLVQMDIICNDDSNAIPTDEIESLGGRVFIVPSFRNLKGHTDELYKLFVKEKYDVVHAYNSMINLFPMYAAKKAGIKARISESLSMAAPGEWKTYIKYMFRPLAHLYCNYYMACGKDCGIYQFGQKAYGDGKIAIFKTAINTEFNRFQPELRDKTRQKYDWMNKVVYGFIGRFEHQKNPLFLIDVMHEIRKRQENAHFAIIGAGILEEEMKMRIHECNLQDPMSWLGRREDIQQFYNAFDCFLLPSLYEGLPVVGLESQSCGLPIFFSTEITQEAKACEMAQFISLKTPATEWAKKIIATVEKNIPVRRSYAEEVSEAGFDSRSEAIRLQQYYIDKLETETGGDFVVLVVIPFLHINEERRMAA